MKNFELRRRNVSLILIFRFEMDSMICVLLVYTSTVCPSRNADQWWTQTPYFRCSDRDQNPKKVHRTDDITTGVGNISRKFEQKKKKKKKEECKLKRKNNSMKWVPYTPTMYQNLLLFLSIRTRQKNNKKKTQWTIFPRFDFVL